MITDYIKTQDIIYEKAPPSIFLNTLAELVYLTAIFIGVVNIFTVNSLYTIVSLLLLTSAVSYITYRVNKKENKIVNKLKDLTIVDYKI